MVAELGGIDSDVVRQEIYGEFLDTTSNVLFNLALIENAFSTQMSNEKASIVWGLDVAREGDDESVLCIRQGYGVTNFYTFRLDSVTALAREIFGIYERSEEKPDAIFIDSVGVGAGVFDTLVDFGLRGIVREAKFSYKATNEKLYANKRAEAYFTLKEKFRLLSIVPNDKLKKQLSTISFYYDKKERYLLLPKENIKKEFGFSPDLADALALTFFDPLPAKINTINYDDGGVW